MSKLAPLLLSFLLFLQLLLFPLLSAAQAPQKVALVAAIGDRIDIVRQREQVGSHIEPYARRTLQVGSQALNFAVLRGLDKAIGEDEPNSTRVLLQWTMPEDVYARVSEATGARRQDVVLQALNTHLQALPQRKDWDRIEVVIPAYTYAEMRGMGTKLSGIGVYVQPLRNQNIEIGNIADTGINLSVSDADGDYRTVNPRTGETAHSSVYVAPYMYFERLTYDAKSLALLKRQRFFDNTKYADPLSASLDVANQMTPVELMGKLIESIERSAYKSVRQKTGEVKVTPPKPLDPASR